MPEIKNTFLQGKMNKDLDERLIPNGQYRNAENIEVSTSEGSNVGTVQNILGNSRVEGLVGNDFKCVGCVADEKNNKLYWLISKYDKDVILEYDADNDVTHFVLVDIHAGTNKAVLKFFGNAITGINIIDNLLLWTDNQGEPKKINIDTCKAGTIDLKHHTQLSFSAGSFSGVTIKSYMNPLTSSKYFYYPRERFLKAIDTWTYSPNDSSNDTVMRSPIRHYRNGEFLGAYNINFFNTTNWPKPDNDPNILNRYTINSSNYIEDAGSPGVIPRGSGGYPNHGTRGRRLSSEGSDEDFREGDVIFGDNVTIDITEQHITVIKTKPLNAPAVKINHSETAQSTSKIPNLFETKFPRFSYRYKYRDGEFSAFAPFTEPVFNPKYTKDTTRSVDGSVLYNQDTAYSIKESYNKAMVNAIHSVELTGFITAQTPEDVVEIDILYKQEDSSVIYSIGTINHLDAAWHDWSNNEGLNIGYGKALGSAQTYAATGGLTGGKYIVTTENIHAALPANQLLRPWDNVPRKALAQEVTGNRVVYGNYLQNYDIATKAQVQVSYSNRQNRLGSFESKGLPSIKSQRNYQLGVVYCDKYGRETPVFTSNNAAVHIPWQDSDGKKNASKSTQLIAGAVNNFPEWVDSLKFFVKETSNEYYNLTMDRAWVTKSTYELEDSQDHLWISFPSSDRNKVSEEDYIILKKKIGAGEEQVAFENKFKVIDIKNEAPDAIKYDLRRLGLIWNIFENVIPNYFPSTANSPAAAEVSTIKIDHAAWKQVHGNGPLESVDAEPDGTNDMPIGTEGLYISWYKMQNNFSDFSYSKRYKVISGYKTTQNYVLQLSTKVSMIDTQLARENSEVATLDPGLFFQVEKKELKDSENFSGKFFVKISKNEISDIVETGSEGGGASSDQMAFNRVQAAAGCWYWQDDVFYTSSPVIAGGPPYGLTNYDGYPQAPLSSSNTIHNSYSILQDQNAYGDDLRVSDWFYPWEQYLIKLSDKSGKPRFFIDSMHMISGQSKSSDYAKFGCITWAGCTKGNSSSAEISSWSYPPLKTWLSEFGHTTNLIIPEQIIPGQVIPIDHPDNWIDFPGLPDMVLPDVTIPSSSVWYDNELVSTSPYINPNPDYADLGVDGWVGPLQNVSRHTPTSMSHVERNHINGLEGLVTSNKAHITGPRRWVSGLNGTDYGVGEDTETYSEGYGGGDGRHFMHLSFFAPGKDLHDGVWEDTNLNTTQTTNNYSLLHGPEAFMGNLQGIWGGGVFTAEVPGVEFGQGAEKHQHLAMEGNYDEDNNYLPEPAGPGVGYGYDLDYRELHERQWDPTFLHDSNGDFMGDPDNEIRDFIRNIYPGSKFRFNHKAMGVSIEDDGNTAIIDEEIYTIKKVQIKKLYNHTSWRKPYNVFIDGYGYVHTNMQNRAYWSVEQAALEWFDTIDDGTIGNTLLLNASGPTPIPYYGGFLQKIQQFGAAHNRRLCYIIELDKDPTASESNMGNPLNQLLNGPNGMSGDLDGDNYTHIEFLDPIQDRFYNLSDLDKFPAVWEVDPKKQQVDLDIYYEASSNIPVRINERTNELFAPVGCKVEIINATSQQALNDVYLVSWDGAEATFDPGFNRGDGFNEIDYAHTAFKFIREDGSYTVAEAGGQQLVGDMVGFKTNFVFKEDIGNVIGAGLAWYNCFSFGNGLESNRIRDDFNEMFISNGVKASTTAQQTYEEERRSHGLIYSGIYNSNSGVNDLNQFIMAEKITKDLNPTYGSIQKLFQRRISLIAFCEDRVVRITSNKDAIYNADGQPQLISSSNVLGDANPFEGNFGISKNPESFASESYRAYFTDKARGVVLRLSKDGLTPISKAGMHDWFRDNLPIYNSLIGTYDSYKEDYNITLSNTYTENIIFNTYFLQGSTSVEIESSLLNIIYNGAIFGENYFPSYEELDIQDNMQFDGLVPQDMFHSTVTVRNHPFIPREYYQTELAGWTGPEPDLVYVDVFTQVPVGTQDYEPPLFGISNVFFNSAGATFATWWDFFYENSMLTGGNLLPGSGNTAPELGGHLYDYGGVDTRIFGVGSYPVNTGFIAHATDPNIYSNVRRSINGTVYSETNLGSYPDAYYPSATWGLQGSILPYHGYSPFDLAASGINMMFNTPGPLGIIGQQADPADGTTWPEGKIVFDRVKTADPTNTYVEFRHMGLNTTSDPSFDGELLTSYNAATGGSHKHSSMFNGDEIEVEVTIKTFPTPAVAPTPWSSNYWTGTISGIPNTESGVGTLHNMGYNHIKPFIAIFDGANPVDSTKLVSPSFSNLQSDNLEYKPFLYTQYNPRRLVYGAGPLNPANIGPWQVGVPTGTDAQLPSVPFVDNFGDNANEFWDDSGQYGNHFVEFAESPEIPGYPDSSGYSAWDYTHNLIRVIARWKFKDPSQPLSSTSINTLTSTPVVDELWVRVGNANTTIGALTSSGGSFSNTSDPGKFNEPWRYPRFEILSVKIHKRFGIIGPEVSADPGTTATYGDISSTIGINEAWLQTQGSTGPLIDELTGVTMAEWDSNLQEYVTVASAADLAAWTAANDPLTPFAQDAIPDTNVEAWVEVIYNNNWPYSFGPGNPVLTNGEQGIRAQEEDWFGVNRGGITSTIPRMNQDPFTGGQADGTAGFVTYSTGLPISSGTPQEDVNQTNDHFEKTFVDAAGVNIIGPDEGILGPSTGTGTTPGQETYSDVTSEWWKIRTNQGSSGYYEISCDITGNDAYQLGGPGGPWYLVDIELDETEHPEVLDENGGVSPSIGGGGVVRIPGVVDNSAPVGNPVDFYGTGFAWGTQTNKHVQLEWRWRTEYPHSGPSIERWVLRAVYQVHSNSWVANNAGAFNVFRVRFYAMQDTIHVKKIITRDVTWVNNSGWADGWERDSIGGNTGFWDQRHTLSTNTRMYYYGSKLCWDNVTDHDIWHQDFGLNTPTTGNLGWTLKFDYGQNPRTQGFSGELGVAVTGNIGGFPTPHFDGMITEGIESVGNYEISFTMDGAISPVWDIKKGGLPYTAATPDEVGNLWNNTNPSRENKIMFYQHGGSPLTSGVGNISLTNQTTIYQGGSVGSWNFDGFEPTIDTYIVWDGDNGVDGRIQFTDCPLEDPNSTSSVLEIITANQLVDKPIKRYEKYEISFTFNMETAGGSVGDGRLHMYYFNNDGFGFRISNIDMNYLNPPAWAGTPVGLIEDVFDNNGNLLYKKLTATIGIGDGSSIPHDSNYPSNWDHAESEIEMLGVEALLNTFVIRKEHSGPLVTGWIDNISMKRVYNIELDDDGSYLFPEKTVTFSEDVNGWTSFKSFIPEAGLSLSKKYYTFNDAKLYQHYVPMVDGATGYIRSERDGPGTFIEYVLEEANNYNTFYDNEFKESAITAVLNAEPSIIKTFNTLNYEGSQAHVTNPVTDLDLNGDPIVTIHNAIAWSQNYFDIFGTAVYPNVDGWKVVDVETDMDSGSLRDFVKKEGKWFGYIKGKHTNTTLDTSRFSVQGIGRVVQVIDWVQ